VTKVAGARDATELEEVQVVRMDGSRAIDHLACLVVAVNGLTHKVDVLGERMARALAKHEVV
jgi:hypothetical protein